MSYQALYREFRPRRFSELVGQEHITTTLKNQIKYNNLSHAYLFCGARGTGKTSTAKIFSRALNCLSPDDGEPCGKCQNCHSNSENDIDIVELDAASNRGVEEMRLLLEKARFTPFKLRYKVYIIDEAHMLTPEAASMLLKTLEEPPEYMIFMLATTEPQKIPATIISRCQRFDFRRLKVINIVERLKQILNLINKTIDEGGLLAIAGAADGSMRDALSLADQCLSFCGNHVSENDVYDVLGSMRPDFLFKMTDALFKSDTAKALLMLDEVVKGGKDIGVFASNLTQHIRALLLVKACSTCSDLLECTTDALERYRSQAKLCSEAGLLRALELLTHTQNDLKWIKLPRILFEAVLVRICLPENEQNLLALSERISRLESLLQKNGHSSSEEALPLELHALDIGTNGSFIIPEKNDSAFCTIKAKHNIKEAPIANGEPEVQDSIEQTQNIPISSDVASSKAEKQLYLGNDIQGNFNKAKADKESPYAPVWGALCKALQSKNFALFQNAKNASSAILEENILCVRFSQTFEAAYNSLNTKKSFELLSALLKEQNPELQLSLRLG